jgi:hypothetical protein
MVSVFRRHRIWLVISASLAYSTAAVAQPHLRGQAAGGYAAGIDSPVLRDGSRSWRTSVWLDRASGAEFGLAIGQDQSEDRTQRTPDLFFDPVGRGTGTQQCVGCLPGTASVRTTISSWYVAPSVSLRQRDGAVRPYLTLALGAYRVRDVRDTRFLPS